MEVERITIMETIILSDEEAKELKEILDEIFDEIFEKGDNI